MSLFGSILRTTLSVVETPLALVKDVATLGSTLTDEDEPYTIRKLKELDDNYDKIKDDIDRL